jgi:hypothetical protein
MGRVRAILLATAGRGTCAIHAGSCRIRLTELRAKVEIDYPCTHSRLGGRVSSASTATGTARGSGELARWAIAAAVMVAVLEVSSFLVIAAHVPSSKELPTSNAASTPYSVTRTIAAQQVEAARASLNTSNPTWSEIDSGASPSARAYTSMVYDARSGTVLLFGGETGSGTALGDTWAYSGGLWTPLSPHVSPPARWGSAMAYDSADGYVVLYGGFNGTATLSDTWKFVDNSWAKLTPTVKPGPLVFASIAMDAATGYVVLFGGHTGNVSPSDKTWEFKAGQWTELKSSRHPAARWMASMAYDAASSKVVLFGGFNATQHVFGDTWTFAAGVWKNVTPSSSPPAAAEASMSYQFSTGSVVLFGGYNGSQTNADTWVFAGSTWTKISSEFAPTAREGSAMADGTNSSSPILFGGISRSGTSLGDTWSINGTVWSRPPVPLPVARVNEMMAYDQADGYVLLFGGTQNGALFGDTWKFSAGVWTELHPTVSPSARDEGAMTYDAADGYVLLFGGHNYSDWLQDTWSFVGGQWSQIQIPYGNPVPDGRGYASIAYDAEDGYVVLFGGYNSTIAGDRLGDTWTYVGGVWSEISSGGGPAPRFDAEMTYDSEDGYVLLFSGFDRVIGARWVGFPDTWSFAAGTWTNVTSALTADAPEKGLAGLVDDTYEGYPVLWGGSVNSSAYSGLSTWVYTGSSWVKLTTNDNPPQNSGFGMAFDPILSEIVLFGNGGATWVYESPA